MALLPMKAKIVVPTPGNRTRGPGFRCRKAMSGLPPHRMETARAITTVPTMASRQLPARLRRKNRQAAGQRKGADEGHVLNARRRLGTLMPLKR